MSIAGQLPPQPSLSAFALYIINFPQLIAGPIIRYRQIADQLAVRATTLGDFEYGVLRFVTGLGEEIAHRGSDRADCRRYLR